MMSAAGSPHHPGQLLLGLLLALMLAVPGRRCQQLAVLLDAAEQPAAAQELLWSNCTILVTEQDVIWHVDVILVLPVLLLALPAAGEQGMDAAGSALEC